MSYFRPRYTGLPEYTSVDSERGEQRSLDRAIGPGIPGPIAQEQGGLVRGDTWERTPHVCSGPANPGRSPAQRQQDLNQIHRTCGTG